MSSFFIDECFPPNWWRRESPFEFSDIRDAVDYVQDPYPVFPGRKDADGVYVLETREMNSFLGSVCAIYYDLFVPNILAVLLKTKDQRKKNMNKYLDGMFNLFEPLDCPHMFPEGPAEA